MLFVILKQTFIYVSKAYIYIYIVQGIITNTNVNLVNMHRVQLSVVV